MKNTIRALIILCAFFLWAGTVCATGAGQVKLTLESYAPATFPTISKIITLPDINDQLEISRQAALFALSEEGWNLENLGLGGFLNLLSPPLWSGNLYSVYVPVQLPVSQEIEELFGYVLTEFGGINDPRYQLRFHTDEWVERGAHDVCESPNNYGTIGGGMEGDAWHQCVVPDWGRFYINQLPDADAGQDQTVIEGTTVTLDGSNSSGHDDEIISYQWEQTAGTPVTLSDPTTAQPTFTAPDVGLDGEALTFQLTVTDNSDLQDADTCIVNITAATITICGIVTDKQTGNPIQGAMVRAVSWRHGLMKMMTTDASGYYEFKDLEVIERVAMKITARGYRPVNAILEFSSHGVYEQNFELQSYRHIVNGTAATITICGIVTDKQTGNPIQGATINAISRKGSRVNMRTTNASGYYVFTDLEVGASIVMMAKAGGYRLVRTYIKVSGDGVYERNFELQSYQSYRRMLWMR